MTKKELSEIIDESLYPLGFKKKGNYWLLNDGPISKMVHLQKSMFSNFFYVNYGYIISNLPLDGLKMHVFNGLGSKKKGEQKRIIDLLNLESAIPSTIRREELKKILAKNLTSKIQKINTEDDLSQELVNRPNINDIPLAVKEYLNLD